MVIVVIVVGVGDRIVDDGEASSTYRRALGESNILQPCLQDKEVTGDPSHGGVRRFWNLENGKESHFIMYYPE